MNLEYFIARRTSGKDAESAMSGPIVTIASLAVTLGVAVMIVAVAIVAGFKNEIRDKIAGFGAHIQIVAFDNNNSFEVKPISNKLPIYSTLKNNPEVKNIQEFALKAGIIKTKEEIHGVLVKGVGADYDWSFFKSKLVEGDVPKYNDTATNNGVLISRKVANLLKYKIGDKVRLFFINNKELRGRSFTISGFYDSGFEEYDKNYVIADIRHIRKINGWQDNQAGGFEVILNDFNNLDKVDDYIYSNIDQTLNTRTIVSMKPEIFNWLDFLNVNISVILILMTIVAAINMISALLILILERTSMIGILKALGSSNASVQKIFLYNAGLILLKGLIWGNLLGIGICLIQYYTGVFKLSAESYYMTEVPIHINWLHVLMLNAGTVVICLMILIIPSFVITRITPIKSIRFD